MEKPFADDDTMREAPISAEKKTEQKLDEKAPENENTRPQNSSDNDRDGSIDGLVQERQPEKPLTFRQKVKQHFRRYWKWHLLATIILLAILLPILFKVIIPAIVQNVVSGQELPIFAGSFEPMSANEVMVSLNTSLFSPLPVTKDQGPLCLYNRDSEPFSPFFNLTLDEQPINHATPANIVNDTVSINNETELVKWLNQMYDQEWVDLSIRSWPLIRVGAIPTYNYLDKTIQVQGLRALSGASVQGLNITLPPPAEGNNLNGTIILPNWSVLNVYLGNLTFDLYSGRIKLGNVSVQDVVLVPGNNTKTFEGRLNLDQLGNNLGPILASQAEPLSRGVVELNATATSVIRNGQHITFLETVLGSKSVPLDISVVTLLSDVITALLHANNKSLVGVLGEVLGNKTFVQQVLNNFNSTGVPLNGTSLSSKIKARRSSSQASLAWTMLKMGMKMRSTGVF